MKDYKFFLFDWGGCLGRTLELWLAAYEETYAEYGLFPPDQDIIKQFGDWNGPVHLGIIDIQEYTSKLMQRLEPRLRVVSLYPGTRELLGALKAANKHLALISTSRRADVIPALKHNHIADYFETVLCAEVVSRHKPDREIIDVAVNNLHANKKESVIIGDSKCDLGAARNAGIDAVLFNPAEHNLFYRLDALMEFKPVRTITSLQELIPNEV